MSHCAGKTGNAHLSDNNNISASSSNAPNIAIANHESVTGGVWTNNSTSRERGQCYRVMLSYGAQRKTNLVREDVRNCQLSSPAPRNQLLVPLWLHDLLTEGNLRLIEDFIGGQIEGKLKEENLMYLKLKQNLELQQ